MPKSTKSTVCEQYWRLKKLEAANFGYEDATSLGSNTPSCLRLWRAPGAGGGKVRTGCPPVSGHRPDASACESDHAL